MAPSAPGKKGMRFIGSVDGKDLGTVTNESTRQRMAFLGSTYDHNLFDNVRVAPVLEMAGMNRIRSEH